MELEQIKPLRIKLTVHVNIANYKAALAKIHNVKPEEVQVLIEDEPEQIEEPPKEMGERKYPPLTGSIVGKARVEPKQRAWLHYFLQEQGITHKEAATLCNINATSVNRACIGQRLRKETYLAIIDGLGLTSEQAKEFRASLKSKQRDYHNKERRKVD